MNLIASRPSAALAALAALSMMASPALARDGRGWGPGHHRHHGDGIDGGDVLAGLLIFGGIAAIASAASGSSRDNREEPYRYPGGPDAQAPEQDDYAADRARDGSDYPPSDSRRDSGSMDEAADRCVGEVERGERRVDTVDSVSRTGEGYRVEGRMRDGQPFSCSIDFDGRVRQAAVDGHAVI